MNENSLIQRLIHSGIDLPQLERIIIQLGEQLQQNGQIPSSRVIQNVKDLKEPIRCEEEEEKLNSTIIEPFVNLPSPKS